MHNTHTHFDNVCRYQMGESLSPVKFVNVDFHQIDSIAESITREPQEQLHAIEVDFITIIFYYIQFL